jgi:hypothetical protein
MKEKEDDEKVNITKLPLCMYYVRKNVLKYHFSFIKLPIPYSGEYRSLIENKIDYGPISFAYKLMHEKL